MITPALISLHGGHSGQFCCHAKDSLEDIIRQYIRLGFTAVGITEHAPPSNDRFLYPDETDSGHTRQTLSQRFDLYFQTLRQLQKKYQSQVIIYAGMETETYTGYISHTRKLIQKYQPDYIVGSVHHIHDICFDYSPEAYLELVKKTGSVQKMYEIYFDLQFEMIKELKPFVVGHFDLIRIYDKNHARHLEHPAVKNKILRNLELIKKLKLVLDFNLRPLSRGETSPYIAPWILKTANAMGIHAVPGDDAHSAAQAGTHVKEGIRLLIQYGFDTNWPVPIIRK